MVLTNFQVLLSVLAYENKGGHIIRRLQEEIQREAQRAEHDVTPIMMSLTTGNEPHKHPFTSVVLNLYVLATHKTEL